MAKDNDGSRVHVDTRVSLISAFNTFVNKYSFQIVLGMIVA
jgi:hypothetical protein